MPWQPWTDIIIYLVYYIKINVFIYSYSPLYNKSRKYQISGVLLSNDAAYKLHIIMQRADLQNMPNCSIIMQSAEQ